MQCVCMTQGVYQGIPRLELRLGLGAVLRVALIGVEEVPAAALHEALGVLPSNGENVNCGSRLRAACTKEPLEQHSPP
jgi:hypothetical protein